MTLGQSIKMMNFFKKTKKQEQVLLLDFGRGFVRGIIFESNGKNKVLDFQSEKIERFGIFDGKDFELDVVKKATNKLIENLGGKTNISHFPKILGFSPDILRAEVLNISFKREEWKGKIAEEEKEEIYKFILEESEKEFFKKADKNVEILKKKILEEKISGYTIPCILGFQGEQMDFKILIIYCSKVYAEFIRIFKKDLHLEEAEIFHSIEALNYLKESYKMFIDIGERNTLICFFKETLEFVADFQIGGHDFTKAIAKGFNLREDEAEAIKEDFSNGGLGPQTSERIKEMVLPVLNLWQECLNRIIKDKTGPFEIVTETYFFGGGSLFPLLEKTKFFLPENLPLENKTKIIFSVKHTPSLLLTFCNNLKSNEKNF